MRNKARVLGWLVLDSWHGMSAVVFMRQLPIWAGKNNHIEAFQVISLSDHEAERAADKARIEDLENLLKAHYSKQFFIHPDDLSANLPEDV